MGTLGDGAGPASEPSQPVTRKPFSLPGSLTLWQVCAGPVHLLKAETGSKPFRNFCNNLTGIS